MPEPVSAAPRVVVVEDDPAIRHFLELALEDLPVRVQACATLDQARRALREGAPPLLITDLRLPDGSGESLVAELAAAQGGRLATPVAVFSASIDDGQRARLAALGVAHLLPKPVPLERLRACVTALPGLEAWRDEAPAAPPAVPGRDDVIARHFGGDAGLHAEFLAACLDRFPSDLAEGADFCQRGDLAALRRLAHSLASVLVMLGREAGHRQARETERLAAEGLAGPAATSWRAVAAQLEDLLRAPPP